MRSLTEFCDGKFNYACPQSSLDSRNNRDNPRAGSQLRSTKAISIVHGHWAEEPTETSYTTLLQGSFCFHINFMFVWRRCQQIKIRKRTGWHNLSLAMHDWNRLGWSGAPLSRFLQTGNTCQSCTKGATSVNPGDPIVHSHSFLVLVLVKLLFCIAGQYFLLTKVQAAVPGSTWCAPIPVLADRKYLPIMHKRCDFSRPRQSNRARPPGLEIITDLSASPGLVTLVED